MFRPNRATTVRECVDNALSPENNDILTKAIALQNPAVEQSIPDGHLKKHTADV